MNYLWLALMVGAVLIGGFEGNLKEVADKSFEMTDTAVIKTAFPLIGIMALWLGIMRLAERSGLVSLLARFLRPLLRRLFPDVPPEHPAMGSMVMNIAANMLGLGNAATPLGLRAMKDLESLNRNPGTATDAMCTFLAINTSSVQLVPVTAMAILAANNSTNPSAIVGTSLIATACACTCGVTTARLLARLPCFKLPPPEITGPASAVQAETVTIGSSPLREADQLKPLRWWGGVILALFFACFGWWFIVSLGAPAAAGTVNTPLIKVVNAISVLLVPFLLSIFPLYAALRGVKIYEEFVEAAKEGFNVAIRIIPYLLAMLVAIGMFRAAGGIDMLSKAFAPLLRTIGFPVDLLPMVLLRPLSGSGTLGLFTELTQHFGPDSLIARTAGTIYGSTETTFYVLAVYFGSVAVRKTRYAVIAGLTADAVSVIVAIILCRAVFG
jgi:spore maturation protein SpmA